MATVFTLTRIGAGPGVAVFSCEQLLGEKIQVVDAAAYNALVEAIYEIMPRYCELFEHAGLGDSTTSVAVQIIREALSK